MHVMLRLSVGMYTTGYVDFVYVFIIIKLLNAMMCVQCHVMQAGVKSMQIM